MYAAAGILVHTSYVRVCVRVRVCGVGYACVYNSHSLCGEWVGVGGKVGGGCFGVGVGVCAYPQMIPVRL